MSDLKRDLRRYIDGLEQPVSVQETMAPRSTRRYGVPTAILAGAAVVLIPALVLVGIRFWPAADSDVAETTIPPTTVTTIVETTTTTLDTTTPPTTSAVVPNLDGLTVAEARELLEEIGFELDVTERYPSRSGFGLITAQGPLGGESAVVGSTVVVGIRVEAECLTGVAEPEIAEGSTAVQVFFECAGDGFYPDISTPVTRAVPDSPDVIEATMRALLAGLSEDERATGLASFFSADSADALNSVTLDGNRLIVDFNDEILINNASTSTGSMYLMAELHANLFQFEQIDSIEFRLNESCDAFYNWLQGECQISTRAEWEQQLEAWDSERELQPAPGEQLATDDIRGKVFSAQLGDADDRIFLLEGGRTTDSGFTKTELWLLDDPIVDEEMWTNWMLSVFGLNEEMVWLVDSAPRTTEEPMTFHVRAILTVPWPDILPTLQSDAFLLSGTDSCTIDGSPDPRLIVVAELAGDDDRGTGATQPLRAWLADVGGATFEGIPTDGIECVVDFG